MLMVGVIFLVNCEAPPPQRPTPPVTETGENDCSTQNESAKGVTGCRP